MMRTRIASVVLVASSITACASADMEDLGSVQQAASVHLKGGPRAKPSFFDEGITLAATGSIAGLGNENVVITIDATANPTGTCTNPAGATQPPGQNPAEVNVTGSVSIPATEVDNGNLTFFVETQPPTTPIPGAPDCPNPQWTERITDLAFTRATITVEQPAGTTVLTVRCTFSQPTTDGSVQSNRVTCTSS